MAVGRPIPHSGSLTTPFSPLINPILRSAALAVLALLAFVADRPSPAQPAPVQSAPQPTPQAAPAADQPSISEDQLKQMLLGKFLYLRGGYLDNSLAFNEHGTLTGHSPTGSFTLCLIAISRVRLTRRRLELEGVRYGLHFLGALPYQDSASAVDRVRITPKKKVVKITIDREPVVKPKKAKEKPAHKRAAGSIQPASAPPSAQETTATVTPVQAAQTLKTAIGNVFAQGLDARMIAAMPPFWRLYYQVVAAKTDFRPSDPAVQTQASVDRKARLLTAFQPPSNEYAQAAGVAGLALYHAVIGPDGKPEEIAVARPIGFGLDENAVEAIRKAQFQPALKNGKPVPVLLDLLVEFRIYSKRTAAETTTPQQPQQPAAPSLPGPYSAPRPGPSNPPQPEPHGSPQL